MTMIDDNCKIYSFDVFDTLVTRRTLSPYGIFKIMESRIRSDEAFEKFSNYFKSNFFNIRINAEYTAKNRKKRQVNLNDIYDVIKHCSNLSDEDVKNLIDLEIKIEKDNIIPIQKNIQLLKQLVNDGKKVLLISDMYLSESQIRDFLVAVDSIFENVPIFVSSEKNCTKSNGSLYQYLSKQYDIKYENWTHYGDNIKADVSEAQKLGINAILLKKNELRSFEKRLLSINNNIDVQAFLGASLTSQKDCIDDYYVFGSTFAAPILYGYINYIIENCKRLDIKHLYFISRDGYILKKIADVVIKEKGINIKNHYFFGSRKAFRIPNEKNFADFIKTILYEFEKNKDIKYIQEFIPIFNNTVFSEITDIEKFLMENKKNILEYFSSKKDVLIKYLKQEINFDINDFAFVDLGGSGYSQDALNDVVNLFKKTNIKTFYFYNSEYVNHNLSSKYDYYISNKGCRLWLELLCRAPHGQVIGYQENENGKVIPIFDEYDLCETSIWNMDSYISGIEEFSKNMAGFEVNNKIDILATNLINIYFDILLKKQDTWLANILGSVLFSSIGTNEKFEIAPPFTYKEAFLYNVKDKLDFIRYARTNIEIQRIINFRKYHNLYLTIAYFVKNKIFSIYKYNNRKIVTIFGIKLKFKISKG